MMLRSRMHNNTSIFLLVAAAAVCCIRYNGSALILGVRPFRLRRGAFRGAFISNPTSRQHIVGFGLALHRHKYHRWQQLTKTDMLAPSQKQQERLYSKSTAESVGLRGLFPASEAVTNGTLPVDEIHTLYYEQHGWADDDDEDGVLYALFLHGGPGAGCFPNHARFFDTTATASADSNKKKYRVVLLDQRGSGRSTPRGEIRRNTLQHLVADCERLREHLGIVPRPWDVVLGGSWGTTLAIAYAQSFPRSVRSLILRGVCLMRPAEIDWMFGSRGGAARRNPTGWSDFASAVSESSSSSVEASRDALHGYYDRLLSTNNATRLAAARSWMTWEFSVFSSGPSSENFYAKAYAPVAVYNDDSTDGPRWCFRNGSGHPLSSEIKEKLGLLEPCEKFVENLRQELAFEDSYLPAQNSSQMRVVRPVTEPVETTNSNNTSGEQVISRQQMAFVPAQNMLTCFYSANDGYALNNVNLLDPDRMKKIQHIPCIAIHGGLDPVCPVNTALDLLSQWPGMELRIPTRSGHSMYDVAITNELVCATDRMAALLKT